MITRASTWTLATAVFLVAATSAQAQESKNIVKLGVIYYTTNSQTDGLHIDPPAAGSRLAGSDVETGNATTLMLSYERLFTPNIGVELVLGIPPKITGTATGPLAQLLPALGISNDVLSAKNLAPTLLLNYHFFEESAKFRPYLGVGVNYTKFISIDSSIPGAQIDMSDSWGWAVQAGLGYSFNKQWGLYASVARIDVSSDVTAKATLPLPGIGPVPLTVKTSVDFKPITYAVGVSYTF